MTTLCTIYYFNYADKGLALYESLEKHCKDFKLYVLAMDDKVYNLFSELNLSHCVPIRLEDIMNDELRQASDNRGIGPFCWTCKSFFIYYLFKTTGCEYCTYLDSDLYFYDDAQRLIDEMIERNASVGLVGHRFPWYDRKNKEFRLGSCCAGTITIKNDNNGNAFLSEWKGKCIECCDLKSDGIHWGDQKYLHLMKEQYDYVIETTNYGAGVAPWNIAQYKCKKNNDEIKIYKSGQLVDLLFYHFENLHYLDKKIVQVNAYMDWGTDEELVNYLYVPYLQVLDKWKDYLKKKTGEDVLIRSHPTSVSTTNAKSPSYYSKIVELLKVFASKDVKNTFFHVLPSKVYRKKNVISF